MEDCLCIIDVQRGFITKETRHIVRNIENLQSQYKHIIVSTFYNDENSQFRTVFNWHKMSRGTQETELGFSAIEHARVYAKSSYSIFTDNVQKHLEAEHIKNIDVCGIDTDISVLLSAANFFQNGLRTRVLSNLCASTAGEHAHESSLHILRRMIGNSRVVQSS